VAVLAGRLYPSMVKGLGTKFLGSTWWKLMGSWYRCDSSGGVRAGSEDVGSGVAVGLGGVGDDGGRMGK
jgi:hypothetical protein